MKRCLPPPLPQHPQTTHLVPISPERLMRNFTPRCRLAFTAAAMGFSWMS
jgi:hypothetical protein